MIHLLLFFLIAIVNPSTQDKYYIDDYWEGLERSAEEHKPIFLLFTGRQCVNLKRINKHFESDKAIVRKLKEEFIPVFLFVDDPTPLKEIMTVDINGIQRTIRTEGNYNSYLELEKYNQNVVPFMVIINANEQILKGPKMGHFTNKELVQFISL